MDEQESSVLQNLRARGAWIVTEAELNQMVLDLMALYTALGEPPTEGECTAIRILYEAGFPVDLLHHTILGYGIITTGKRITFVAIGTPDV